MRNKGVQSSFMNHRYLILGAGMQGTAAAYDLALFAESEQIVLADMDPERAEKASGRVNRLVQRDACSPLQVDVLKEDSLVSAMESADVVLSCVPYWMHPDIAIMAIATQTNMCDLGGNTEITWKTLELDDLAKRAEVTMV